MSRGEVSARTVITLRAGRRPKTAHQGGLGERLTVRIPRPYAGPTSRPPRRGSEALEASSTVGMRGRARFSRRFLREHDSPAHPPRPGVCQARLTVVDPQRAPRRHGTPGRGGENPFGMTSARWASKVASKGGWGYMDVQQLGTAGEHQCSGNTLPSTSATRLVEASYSSATAPTARARRGRGEIPLARASTPSRRKEKGGKGKRKKGKTRSGAGATEGRARRLKDGRYTGEPPGANQLKQSIQGRLRSEGDHVNCVLGSSPPLRRSLFISPRHIAREEVGGARRTSLSTLPALGKEGTAHQKGVVERPPPPAGLQSRAPGEKAARPSRTKGGLSSCLPAALGPPCPLARWRPSAPAAKGSEQRLTIAPGPGLRYRLARGQSRASDRSSGE